MHLEYDKAIPDGYVAPLCFLRFTYAKKDSSWKLRHSDSLSRVDKILERLAHLKRMLKETFS